MNSDFWPDSTVAVVGGGSWGTAIAHLVAKNAKEVRLWMRSEETARTINSTRMNPRYLHELNLSERIRAYHEIERVFEGGVNAVLWVLPSSACREQARSFAKYFKGDEILIHATKGVEPETLKRVSQVLDEELPCPRIGVLSGPNLANEIARDEPAATIVASHFEEVIQAGQALFRSSRFRVYGQRDVVGVEWAGTLKNILAIASGCVDAMGLGWNARSMLISRGLVEMVRFSVAMGASPDTFLGLAGVGDLLATCSSSLSRNYRVGHALGSGKTIDEAVSLLGSVAEGVRTTKNVFHYASERGIVMPITEVVYRVIYDGFTPEKALDALMVRPYQSREDYV